MRESSPRKQREEKGEGCSEMPHCYRHLVKAPREAKVVSDEKTVLVGADGTSSRSSLVNGVYRPLTILRNHTEAHIGNCKCKNDSGPSVHSGGKDENPG